MFINETRGEVSRWECPHLLAILQSMLVTFHTWIVSAKTLSNDIFMLIFTKTSQSGVYRQGFPET